MKLTYGEYRQLTEEIEKAETVDDLKAVLKKSVYDSYIQTLDDDD